VFGGTRYGRCLLCERRWGAWVDGMGIGVPMYERAQCMNCWVAVRYGMAMESLQSLTACEYEN